MRATELYESATPVLYHYTSIPNAQKIISTGLFRLTNSLGTRIEREKGIGDKPFYLSLTRTRLGDYHRYISSFGACMLVLDGNWFNSRYTVKPIDYWDRMWNNGTGERTRESEDRVYSNKPSIPSDAITEVHLYIAGDIPSAQKQYIVVLLITCKKHQLPVFVYNDAETFRLLDKRKALSFPEVKQFLSNNPEKQKNFPRYRRRETALSPVVELIRKSDRKQLTPRAEKLAYNIQFYSDSANVIEADIHNSRKPNEEGYDEANFITSFIRGKKLDGIPGLVAFLKEKWKR